MRWLIAGGGSSRGPCSVQGERSALGRKVGVLNGLEVAGRALDAEAEEVAKTSYVAAGGADLMEDAVLPQSLGPERGVLPGEGVSCGNETGCGAPVDEQVRVDAVGPGARAVVEPANEPEWMEIAG